MLFPMNHGRVDPNAPPPKISAFQVIHGAMISGVTLFAVIAGFLGPDMAAPVEGTEPDTTFAMFHYIALGVLAAALPISLFLPRALARGAAKRRQEALAEVDQGLMPQEAAKGSIMGAVLLEGPGLFGCVVVLLTGNLWVLAIPAVSVLVMALRIPTQGRVRRLIESV